MSLTLVLPGVQLTVQHLVLQAVTGQEQKRSVEQMCLKEFLQLLKHILTHLPVQMVVVQVHHKVRRWW